MTKQLPHDHGQAMEHELDHMPSAGEFQTAAEIFKQLGGHEPSPDFLAAVPL